MLKNLLQIPGADPKMITVFIDGYFDVSTYTGGQDLVLE